MDENEARMLANVFDKLAGTEEGELPDLAAIERVMDKIGNTGSDSGFSLDDLALKMQKAGLVKA